jgi:large repetitive protein
MKKLCFLLALVVISQPLYGQSTITIGRGSSVSVGSGSGVAATNRDGTMLNSGAFNGRSIVFDPVATAGASATASSFTANWNASSGATGYRLDVSTDVNFGSFVTGYQNLDVGNMTSRSVTGLSAGTTYYYRVRAYDIDGITGYSNAVIQLTAPVAPAAIAASNLQTASFSANWNAVTGATSYYLDIASDEGFTSMVSGWDNVNVGNVTTYAVGTNIAGGTTYYYRVRAANTGGSSVSSNTMTALTIPPATVQTAASALAQTSFQANWGASVGATKYYVDVSTINTFASFVTGWNNTDVGNSTSYSINTGLAGGTTYYCRVRAYNASGASANSNIITILTVPPNPVATAASVITQTSFTANWSSSTSATKYFIDVATDSMFSSPVTGWSNVDVDNVTAYAISSNLTAGTAYYYRIRALGASGTSGNSNFMSLVTIPPAPATIAATSITNTSFSANWNAADGVTKYYLDVSANSAFSSCVTGWNNLDVGNVTTFSVNSNLSGGVTYYYRVRAKNDAGTSANSNATTLTLIPPEPVASAATGISTTSFSANWNAATNATSYYLDVATDNGFSSMVTGWSNADVGNVTTYAVSTNLTAGTNYYYRVRAMNATGTSGNSGTTALITAPVTPVAVSASDLASNSFKANWNAVAGATGYYLDVSTNTNFDEGTFVTGYENLDVSNVTSYSVASNVTAGTTHYYRVRSYNTGGTSGSSNKITFMTLPAAPIASAATSLSASGFTANWNSSASATGYRLDVSTASDFSSFVAGFNNLDVANVLTYAVTGLSANSTCYYRVRAYNAYGAGGNSTTVTVLTAPGAPTTLAASPKTVNGFTANWNSIAGATGYYLDVSTVSNFASFVSGLNSLDVGNVTSYLISGLSASSTYYYRVRAYSTASPSGNSDVQSVLTLPVAPVASAATAMAATSFTANWSASASADGYRLDVATDAAFSSLVGTYSDLNVGNVTSQSVTGLTSGTTYYYRVRAFNTSGANGNSNIVSVTTIPPAPSEQAATSIVSNGFNANWIAASGATGYKLDVSTVNTFLSFVPGYNDLDVGNMVTYPVTGLSAGTPYYYRIRAYNTGGNSGNSGTINPTTSGVAPRAPASIPASAIAGTSFSANWVASSGASSYRLDVSTVSSFASFVTAWENVNVGNVTTYSVNTNISEGTQYYYRVRAVSADGTSDNSSTISILTVPPAPVEQAAATVTNSSFDAKWNASTGATGYRLDVATNSGFGGGTFVTGYENLDVSNVTTFAVTGLSGGTSYHYRIRAYNTGGTSASSGVHSMVTLSPGPVATAATTVAATSFDANWNASSGATGYELDVATSSGFGAGTFVAGYEAKVLGNILTQSVGGLTAGTTYYIRVRATNGSGADGNSNIITVSTIPSAPTEQAASSTTSNGFTANWLASAGATGYKLDVATNSGFGGGTFVSGYEDLDVGNVLTYPVTGLSAGTAYHYRIRAYNTGGNSGNSGTIDPTTTGVAPRAPASAPASAILGTSFSANWVASSGATSYRLDVSTVSSFASFVTGWQNVDVGNVTTYAVSTNITEGTQYYYRLRAVSADGTSGNSSTISVVTVPPAPADQAATNILNGSFDANWLASTGATGYRLDVATDAGFTSFVSGYNNLDVGNVTTYTVKGLTGSTSYFYQIRAYNTGGTSSSSFSINPTTSADPVGTVVATPATAIGTTGFSANWNAFGGTQGYRLDVATSSGFGAGTFVAGFEDRDVANVTTYPVAGLTGGTAYYYRVRAYNADLTIIGNSGTVSVSTVPPAPTAAAAGSWGETYFSANWSSSTGATGYYLDVATDAGFTSFVAGFNNKYVDNVTSYSVTGLTAGTRYYYQVRSKNGSGVSGNSGPIDTYTIPKEPTASAASTIQSTSFAANWSASTGVSGYKLDVSTVSNFASFVVGWQDVNVGNVLTYAVNTGLSSGTAYYYRVRAYNSGGVSGNSGVIPVTTAPAAPTVDIASSVDKTSFTANWTSSTGATKYFLDVATSNTFAGAYVAGYQNLDVGNTTSRVVNGLAQGTTYYYRVRAFNSNGTSIDSGTESALTLPAVPAVLPVTVVHETDFTAAWSGVTGATKYYLDVSTSSTFASYVPNWQNVDLGNVTSKSVNSDLSAGTTYYFRVRAYDATGLSENSATVSTSTPPAKPVSSAATSVGETNFTANWSSATGATGYYLDVATDAGFTSFVTGFNNKYVNNVTTYSVTGLAAGTRYYYQVRSKNASGVSDNSLSIDTYTKPKEPVISAASAVQSSSFTANWSASTGATKYYLDVSTDVAFGSFVAGWNNTDVGNVTSYSVNTGLSSGTAYYYRLRAYNTAGTSGNSSLISLTTAPAAPTANNASLVSKTSFTANWTASTGASKYFLDVATTNTFDAGTYATGYLNLDVANVTSAAVNGLANGSTYYYRVRAFNSNGTSSNSGVKSALTLPAAPAVLPVTVLGETNFTAAWNSVTSATKYYLDVSTSSTFASFVPNWQNVDVGNVTSKSVNTDLSAGTTYYFRVRAYNATGSGDNSETITTTTSPPTPTATAATSPGETHFDANWNASAGAAGYHLDVSTVSSFASFVSGFNQKDVANVTSYTVTGLTGGTTYYYRVSSYIGAKSSSYSGTITALASPAAPVTTAASSPAVSSLSANWNSVTGASGYYLDVATSSGFTSFVAGFNNKDVSNVTTYSVTGLSANTTYYYRVRAYNASGTGTNSNTSSGLTIPAAPTAIAATAVTNTTLNANWNASAGVSGYKLEVSTDPAYGSYVFGFDIKDVGNVTTYAVTGLNGSVTYYYRVRAYNASGIGATSGSITTTTLSDPSPAPVATNASSLAQTSFSANWNTVATATGYKLDVATDMGFTSFVSGFEDLNVGNVTTYSVTGLATGTTYYFRTRSYNATGTSSNSNVKTVLTIPVNPTVTSATTIAETGFTANWNASPSAATYFLDLSTDPAFGSFVGVYNNKDVGNVTTLSFTGLSSGTSYYCRVRANNASGTSGNSGTVSALTKPAAPVASAATSLTTTGFSANWAAATGTSTYHLDLSTDPAFGSFVPGYDDKDVGNVTTYSAASLTSYSTYYYRVRAINATGTSSNSGVTTVVGITTANAATSVTGSGFNANWTAVAGATKYYLDVATDNLFTAFVAGFNNKDVGDVSVCAIPGLTTGTAYYFRVRVSNATGTSPSSNVQSTVTKTADPVATAASGILSTSFSGNWGAVTGAAGYYISVAVDSPLTAFVSGWENKDIGNVTTISVNTDILGGTTYYYQVSAYNASGVSGSSNIIPVVTVPSLVELNAATAIAQTSFSLNWNASGGATKYYLDLATDTAFTVYVAGFSNKDVGTVTTLAISGLSTGTKYFYRVRANNASGTSPNSIIQSTTTIPGDPVAIAATAVLSTGFTANWNAAVGAVGYYLDIATDAAFTSVVSGWQNKDLGNVTTLAVNTNIVSGTTHYYRLRAYNWSGVSGNSNSTTVLTVSAPPVLSNASNNTQTSFSANWNMSTGATKYYLDVATDSTFTTFIGGFNNKDVGDVTTYSVTGLSITTAYCYQVRSSNASGTSPNSGFKRTMTLTADPVTVAATSISSSSFTANWNAVSGAAGYSLDVATDAAFTTFVSGWQNKDVGNVLTLPVNTNVAGGTTHYYRVRAYNLGGASGNSNVTSLLTIPVTPALNNASDLAQTSFTINWTASTGATKYFLDVSTDNAFTTYLTGLNNKDVGNVTAYPLTGLTTGTYYYYRVRSYNASGTSPSSTVQGTTPLLIPAVPVAVAATNVASTSFSANWNAVPDAAGYYLDVATDSAFTNLVSGLQNVDVGGAITYPVSSNIISGTTYFYRVRAYNASGIGGRSNTARVLTTPLAPVLNNATAFTQTSFTAYWNASYGATTYYLDAATDSAFTMYLSGFEKKDVGNVTSYTVTGLSTGTTYYFRIRAGNDGGMSGPSTVGSSHLNVPPALVSIEDSTLSYFEGSTIPVTGTIAVRDTDNTTLFSAEVQISGNYVRGEDVLRFSDANGITGIWNAETGTLSLSGTTLLSAYQTALRSVAYQNTSQNPATLTRTIRFVVHDGTFSSAAVTRNVAVISVNSRPLLAGIESAPLMFTEGSDAKVIAGSLTVSDPDDATLSGAFVQIQANYLSGEDVLTSAGLSGITATWNNATGTLELRGSSALANYQTLLRSVTYRNSSRNPGTGQRTVLFIVNDEHGAADTTARNITVVAKNDPPSLSSMETSSLSFTEGGAPIIVSGTIAVADPDNTALASAVIRIVGNYQTGADVLGATGGNGISGRWNSADGTLFLTGQATLAQYQEALRSITFQNTSPAPLTAARTVMFTVNDGADSSNTVTREITVTSINNAPVLSLMEQPMLEYTEGALPVPVSGTLTVNDPDSPTLAGAQVQVAQNYVAAEDLLSFTNANGINGSWDSQTGTLTLSGQAPVEQYQAALRSITYRNTSQAPSVILRTIQVTVNDGIDRSGAQMRSIRITPVNNAPVLASIERTVLEYLEGTEKAITDSVTVYDVDSPMLAGASVRIIGNYLSGEDVLRFTNGNGIAGSWDASTGTLSLGGSSTVQNYQAALRSIRYANTAHPPSTLLRSVSISVIDGADHSEVLARSIRITRLNIPPVLTSIESTALTYTVKQDELQITNTLIAQDSDSPELTGGVVRIGSNYLPAEDELLFTAQNGIVGRWESAGGTLTLSGKAALNAYQTAIRSVRYMNKSITPTAASKAIRFAVGDGVAASDTVTRTVIVSGANTPPILSGIETTVLKYALNSPALVVSAGIGASDADNKNLQKAEIRIAQGLVADEDVLSVTVPGSMTAQYDARTGVLTISGQDIVSSYAAVLRGVKYNNVKGNTASKSTKKVAFTVWDGIAWSAAATRDIDVEGIVSAVESLSDLIPEDFVLRQNFPNPFNPSTTIHFGVPEESRVTLVIYDTRGRVILDLAQKQIPAGNYRTVWSATNLPSGVYYCRMVAVGIGSNRTFTETKKLMLLK